METIGILNQKGGVAKTTTASALAYGLSEKRNKVLVVDMDAQCNLTEIFGFNPDELKYTAYDLMKGDAKIEDCIYKTKYKNMDLLPSSPELAALDIIIGQMMQREFILNFALQKVADKYDYIIIDTPPTLGMATINVLVACTRVIIPSEAEIFSIKGTKFMYERIELVRRFHDVQIMGILLTRVERTSNDKLVSENSKVLAESFKTRIFNTRIRSQKNVKESRMRYKNVIEYSRETRKPGKEDAGSDYENFVTEFLNILKEEKRSKR